MNYLRLAEVIDEIGRLGIEKRRIKNQRDELKEELMSLIEEHRDEFLEMTECDACRGTGKTLTGKKCMSCLGMKQRFLFNIEVGQPDFSCKIYPVNQFVASPNKAREALDSNVFRSLFKLTSHEKIDVRLNADAQANCLTVRR